MMTWKPIDFEGIVSSDKPLDVELNQYLSEKEGHLGESIIHSAGSLEEDIHPKLLPSQTSTVKLSEALEVFEKKIHRLNVKDLRLNRNDFDLTVALINKALWEYVEILESYVVELFEQLDRIGLDKWSTSMVSSINSVEGMLMHRMEEVSWAIKRLEKVLWKYHRLCLSESQWKDIRSWLPWHSLIDQNLLSDLDKSKKFLLFRQKKFNDRMTNYKKFHEKIEKSTNKFSGYHIYNSLDLFDQETFKRIYQLLKLWELNETSQTFPNQNIVLSIQQVQSSERIYHVFHDYYCALRDAIFLQARLFKLGPEDLWKDVVGRSLALKVILGHRLELLTLKNTIEKYHDFINRTDSNSYTRSHWKFFQWKKKEEPAQTNRLLQLAYKTDALERVYEKLRDSLEKEQFLDEVELSEASNQIAKCLHEMFQPLSSRSMMRTNAEKIINILSKIDELGSYNDKVVDFMSHALSKTLRADWKYNTVFDFPEFTEIYEIHKGLLGESEDRQHLSRLNRFKHIIQQIEEWAKKKTTSRHLYEIEQDLSDIKTDLQDFLSFAQKVSYQKDSDYAKDQAVRQEISRQLLEYRYLFGKFLHQLSHDEMEDNSLRHQFLFIHQYFEAIENVLQGPKSE